jgi:formylglycine-generating enzyme required for sulfatase activity
MAIVQEPLDIRSLSEEWQSSLQPYLLKKPEERPELRAFGNKTQNECTDHFNGSLFSVSNDETFLEPSKVNGLQVEDKLASEDRIFKIKDIPFKMVFVEGGTFEMGSNDSDAYPDESPVHSVMVSNYYLGETEVTQALWKAIMGRTPSFFTGDDLPVENVSWNDCQKFIQKLNQLTDKKFRLPTEAEWEYAAQGGIHQSENKYSGSDAIEEVAWYTGNSNSPKKVRLKSPNTIGLYDMSGNVWEWCEDWYNSNYYSSSPKTNPKGMSSGSNRVLRGGGWNYKSSSCRVTRRHCDRPSNFSFSYGLRLALSY